MIVVQTRTSASRSQKRTICRSSVSSSICPCAMTIRASGSCSLQPGGLPVDRRDPVVDPEHLAFAEELSADRAQRETLVVAADVGEHRLPILGRRVDRGHLPDAGERHLERPRDRRGRHRQDVDVRAEPLQALLVRHAEPLLLVDDQQPEIPERDVGAEQAVRADHHVHAARGDVGDDVLLLRR